MKIIIENTLKVADLHKTLTEAGYRISPMTEVNTFFLDKDTSGDCEVCGKWTSHRIDGGCVPCNHHHNINLTNQGYDQ